jgi:hypothetical protein
MSFSEWKFREMSRGEINIDPIEGEFFSAEALGSLSDALIREAIQNSLDASIPGEKTKVIISFSSSDEQLLPPKSRKYINGLYEHMMSEQTGLLERINPNEPIDYILIEDFGTRGLEGEIRENEDKRIGRNKNDFFYFWRNIGRAVEGSTARGRWGLGKTVFQAASRINSFFGVTIRRNDPRKLLMGQSVLKIHWTDGKKFAPYGYYGTFDGDFVLPVEQKEVVEEFCRDFSLRRKEESGLSVVIPFPDKDISAQDIIRAIVNQYFFPILSDSLEVIVMSGQSREVINSESIIDFVSLTDWMDKEEILKRLELAKWSIGLSADDFVQLLEPPTDQAPKWDDSLFVKDHLELLRKNFDASERIAIIIPLWIQRTGENLQRSSFKVFLEREMTLEKGEDFFIRDGLSITGVSSLRQKGMRVIVSVSDKPLSKLLGDSENPAHTEWQERSPKFKGRYNRGPSCLRFVKNSPREIVKIISRPAEGRDLSLLRDIFYIDLPKYAQPHGETQTPDEHPGPGESNIPRPEVVSDQFLQMKRTTQGFRLTVNPKAKRIPKYINVQIAYDIRQGNPFRKYSIFDFDLDKPPIRISAKGIVVKVARQNIIQLELQTRDCWLQITGFDPKRDLKIKTMTSLDENI